MIKIIVYNDSNSVIELLFEERTLIGHEKPINPKSFLISFVDQAWQWTIDFSQATASEIRLWSIADLRARIIRALQTGLAVRFVGKDYRTSPDRLWPTIKELEDQIVSSGRIIAIDSDDENGLIIGVRGYE